jgi:ferredoxin-NADP reductase
MRAARAKVCYETWHGVHLLTYLAISLSFVHELAGPNLAGHLAVQVVWSLLYAYAFALVIRYRLLAPLLTVWRHRLRVRAVIPEANGVVSLIMRGQDIHKLAAQPGQFFRWRFMTGATYVSAHPFSLSAPPNGDLLRITVKAFGTGSRLVHSVQPGTLVFAEGPSGVMTAQRRTQPSVLLIADGVGITPMRALFETLHIGDGRLSLIYRAPTPADIISPRELQEIAQRRGADVHWMIGPSTDPANQFTAENLLRLVPDLATRDVYLCASAGVSAAVRAALRSAGLPGRRLHEEVFTF